MLNGNSEVDPTFVSRSFRAKDFDRNNRSDLHSVFLTQINHHQIV